MTSITEDIEGFEYINKKKYKIIERITTFDDVPDKDGNCLDPIIEELSREEIVFDKDKIIELQTKINELETSKIDFETRIAELETKTSL